MAKRSRSPRSSRGVPITKAMRKRLAALDRKIGKIDYVLGPYQTWVPPWLEDLARRRKDLDFLRKNLRNAMKGYPPCD